MARILIVDDEHYCLEMLELLLSAHGHTVAMADSGDAALLYMRQNWHMIDMVLLDIMMPGKTGIDVLKEMRCIPELRGLKVIIQSGTSNQSYFKSAEKMGAAGCIIKPYKMKELTSIIDQTLSAIAA